MDGEDANAMENPITFADLLVVTLAVGAVWLIGTGLALVGLIAQERTRRR